MVSRFPNPNSEFQIFDKKKSVEFDIWDLEFVKPRCESNQGPLMQMDVIALNGPDIR